MEAAAPPPKLAFGPFVLDPASRGLLRDGHRLPLGQRAFSLLLELATNPGVPLSKDTLVERVWPDAGVSDEAVAQAVHELRAVLGDNPRSPRYLQTIHGYGYCFIAEVHRLPGEPAPAAKPAMARRTPWAVLAVAGSLMGIAALLALLRPWTPEPATAVAVELAFQLPGGAFKPAYSPDGRLVALVSVDTEGFHSLFLARHGLVRPFQLTRRINVRGVTPSFSADGNWLLFTRYRKELSGLADVWRVPALGGPPQLLVEEALAAHQDPSGQLLAFTKAVEGGSKLFIRQADGSERLVGEPGFWPRWSPDGQWLAYTTSDPEGGGGHLYIVRRDGGERRQLTFQAQQFYGLDWTRKPLGVVFAASTRGPFQLWWVGVDGGPPKRLTTGAGDDSCPAVAPDDSHLLFVHGRMRSSVFYATSSAASLKPAWGGPPLQSLSVHPQRDLLVLALQDLPEANLRIVDPLTEEEQPVPSWTVSRARWSASGEALVLAGVNSTGNEGIAYLPWPGTTARWLVSPCSCDWPDLRASLLAYTRPSGSKVELVVRDLTNGREAVLTAASELIAVRLSPSGRAVAWSGDLRSTDPTSAGIWVKKVEGGTSRRLSPDGAFPVWLDEETIRFLRTGKGPEIWQVRLPGGSPVLVRSLDLPELPESFDVAGQRDTMALALHQDTPQVYRLGPLSRLISTAR